MLRYDELYSTHANGCDIVGKNDFFFSFFLYRNLTPTTFWIKISFVIKLQIMWIRIPSDINTKNVIIQKKEKKFGKKKYFNFDMTYLNNEID